MLVRHVDASASLVLVQHCKVIQLKCLVKLANVEFLVGGSRLTADLDRHLPAAPDKSNPFPASVLGLLDVLTIPRAIRDS